MKNAFNKTLLSGAIASTLLLSGCGGSDSNSPTSSNQDRTAGIITGFGSIYVNGIKFDTDNASYDIDDDKTLGEGDLRVGMHVKINGTINNDGKTGSASQVVYENELEGPVSAIVSSSATEVVVTILGVNVTVNSDTTFDDDYNLDMATIQVGDILEVSGFTSTSGITATHIEKQSNSSYTPDVTEFEIKGSISNLDTNAGLFNIGSLNIGFDLSTELDDIPGNSLVDGLYVEVKGTLNAAGDLLSATKIEAEDDGLGDDDADEVEIEGIISNYDSVNLTFSVQGQDIDASNSPMLIPASLTLANDLKVEVEGDLVNGVLIAEEIKAKGKKIKIQGVISEVDTTNETISFILFGGSVISSRVNLQTEMEDELRNTSPFTLLELQPGDFVELEAFDDGSNDINAVELKRKSTDSVELEAAVTEFDSIAETVTILGQTFDLTNAMLFDENEVLIANRSEFFDALESGSHIELEDEYPADGIIDEAELDD